jgi:hypothetical protein
VSASGRLVQLGPAMRLRGRTNVAREKRALGLTY